MDVTLTDGLYHCKTHDQLLDYQPSNATSGVFVCPADGASVPARLVAVEGGWRTEPDTTIGS